ncbi:AAA+ superfamily predicted ATPase [Dyella sp. SG562]|uniref:DUF2730 family protein n=1 Tax=Dyella sp. SG562 TaxID=2587017 RepID=UPI00141F31A8|nr:DUF2730 family protein [Dyella sp. SG562]NII74220.1 AAA+ superfamily predicted ATPase [Dyella sp. SG562]
MNEPVFAVVAAIIIVLLLINLVGLLVIGARVGRQANDAHQLEQRLTKLEARVDNLPTHRDFTELRGDLSEVVETTAGLSGQMTTVAQMLRTIQEHLLEND